MIFIREIIGISLINVGLMCNLTVEIIMTTKTH